MMEYFNAKTIIDDLKKYDLAKAQGSYIQITQWVYGEGWDIDINGEKHISISFDEFEAIKHLISCLTHETDKFKNKETI